MAVLISKPLLFITGFLGSGKTTLLRSLLSEYNRNGLSADVILNDFENADLDAATLPDSEALIAPLSASCACCESLEDLVKLCLAAQKGRGDALLIELNGTADPLPILEVFTVLENEMSFAPRWQVAMVDARYWGKRQEFSALEARQVETATHWILSHDEAMAESAKEEIVQSVESKNPSALRIEASQMAARLMASATQSITKVKEPGGECRVSGKGHTHDEEHTLSHRFTGCQIALPGRFRREQIIRFLESLPAVVVRAKVLVKIKEDPGVRWLFERTGQDPAGPPQKVDVVSKASPSLICIGPGLEPDLIREMVKNSFGI